MSELSKFREELRGNATRGMPTYHEEKIADLIRQLAEKEQK